MKNATDFANELRKVIKDLLRLNGLIYEEYSAIYLGCLTLKAGFEIPFLDGTNVYLEITGSGIRVWDMSKHTCVDLSGNLEMIEEYLDFELRMFKDNHDYIDL